MLQKGSRICARQRDSWRRRSPQGPIVHTPSRSTRGSLRNVPCGSSYRCGDGANLIPTITLIFPKDSSLKIRKHQPLTRLSAKQILLLWKIRWKQPRIKTWLFSSSSSAHRTAHTIIGHSQKAWIRISSILIHSWERIRT